MKSRNNFSNLIKKKFYDRIYIIYAIDKNTLHLNLLF